LRRTQWVRFMDGYSLLIFAVALAIAAGSPGPSVAALVARVINRGWREMLPFVAAMWLGEVIWLGCAAAGVAAVARQFHWLFVLVKYAGIAYLLFLAWQMWFTDCRPGAVEGTPPAPRGSLFLTGLTVTLGNPKIMIFYVALLPAIVDLGQMTWSGFLLLAAVTVAVLAVIDLSYVLLAMRARRWLQSRRAMQISNRISASVMSGAAVTMAAY